MLLTLFINMNGYKNPGLTTPSRQAGKISC